MRQVTTRLTRELDGVWLLELTNPASEKIRLIEEDSTSSFLKLLTRIEVRKFVVDFTSVREFDSQGILLLCLIHKQLIGRSIQTKLRNPQPHLLDILHITQLDQIFEIEYTDW